MFSRPLKIGIAAVSVVGLLAAIVAVNARHSWRPIVVELSPQSSIHSPAAHLPIAWNGEELWLLTSSNNAMSSIRALVFQDWKVAKNWNRSSFHIIAPVSSEADMIALSRQKNVCVLSHGESRLELWRDRLRIHMLEQRPEDPHVLVDRVRPLLVSPDGRRLVVSSRYSASSDGLSEREDDYPGNMTVFDLANGRIIARCRNTIGGSLSDFAWSPDSREVAGITANGWVFVLDIPTGKLRLQFRAHQFFGAQIAWSPDGKTFVTGSNTRLGIAPTPLCLDFGDGSTCLGRGPGTSSVGTKLVIVEKPNGELTWNGRTERLLKRFDARTGKPIGSPLTLQTGAVDIAFAPNGEQLAIGEHGFALILNPSTFAIERRLPISSPVRGIDPVCVAWSPDGATLATSTMSRLTLWRAR